MKKTLALLISLVMLCSLCIPAFANDTTVMLLNGAPDEPPIYDAENERRNAEKELEMMLSPAYDPDAEPFVSVTFQKQITSYYCGPACGATVLDALNVSIPSSSASLPFFEECLTECPYPSVTHTCVKTYNSPQVTLGSAAGTNSGYATTSTALKNIINSKLSTNYYAAASVSSASNLAQRLTATLMDGHPVILGVQAHLLDKYPSGWGGHYIVVYGYDSDTETVYILDPNYDNRYNGFYTETLSTVYNALFVNDHQIIW